jgi:hypothetical protein
MNEYYESIKNKTVCTECDGKEMAIGYLYENSGIVKIHTELLGLSAYKGTSNMLMIICKKCGFVNKSFVFAR